MIKIYGPPRSSAGRCYLMLEELGVQYEVAPLDMMGGDLELPEYLRLNPNGKVPALVDGDLVLWESVAINLYLAEKYRPELLGRTPEIRGKVYQWSVWSMTEFQDPLVDLLIQQRFVPAEKRNQKVIDEAQERLPGLLSIVDMELGGSDYLAGSEYTLADLNVASVANIALALGVDLNPYRKVGPWLARIKARPAWQIVSKLREE